MTWTAWERVCAVAKPGDTLHLEGLGLKMTGQLIRGGRVLRTVRWTSPPQRDPSDREVTWSKWEVLPNGLMLARTLLPEEAPRLPRARRLDFEA